MWGTAAASEAMNARNGSEVCICVRMRLVIETDRDRWTWVVGF